MYNFETDKAGWENKILEIHNPIENVCSVLKRWTSAWKPTNLNELYPFDRKYPARIIPKAFLVRYIISVRVHIYFWVFMEQNFFSDLCIRFLSFKNSWSYMWHHPVLEKKKEKMNMELLPVMSGSNLWSELQLMFDTYIQVADILRHECCVSHLFCCWTKN